MKFKLQITLICSVLHYTCMAQTNRSLTGDAPTDEPAYKMMPGIQYNLTTKRYGVLDSNLNVTVPFEYEAILTNPSNFMVAVKNGKYGVIDRSNKVIYDFKYARMDYLEPYMVGVIEKEGTTFSFLVHTVSGKELIPLKKGYNLITIESDYKTKEVYFKASNTKAKTVDFFNSNGKKTNHFNFNDIKPWGDYYISVLNGKQGVLAKDGRELLRPEYEHIGWIDHDKACVYAALINNQAIVLDLKTNEIISSEYSSVRRPEDDNGFMVVRKRKDGADLYGIINPEFKEVFPLCNCDINYNLRNKQFEITDKLTKENRKLTVEDLMDKK